MPPLTPEFIATLAALTIGAAFGIYMAARRRPHPYERIVQLAVTRAAIEDNQYRITTDTPVREYPIEEVITEMPEADETNIYRQAILPLQMKRDPALIKRIQEVARAISRPGGITSANVITALKEMDPVMHKRLMAIADRRGVMGATFDGDDWVQTDEWRPTGSHGRPQRVWILKEGKS